MQQSNTYIIIFSVVMTIIIGGLMSITSVVLKPAQDRQVELDTKKKILGAVMDISAIEDPEEILRIYAEKVKSTVVDFGGNPIETDTKGNPLVAEKVNVQKNYKTDPKSRVYPVYMVMDGDKIEAYVLPLFGAGLWDWISGYIALDGDLNTVKGIAFDHKSETPGLGARITDAEVQGRFKGKKIFTDGGELASITMVKGEGKSGLTQHEVDGLSGATLTAKGVNRMLEHYLGCYQNFFKKVKSENKLAANY
ncbi:MAG: NADH:ubiquinone reductase (Na(+)-transporting) subunit C [Cyclobacteriaceae bacterium]